jgi:Mrp family chromosome partitioning ATPase
MSLSTVAADLHLPQKVREGLLQARIFPDLLHADAPRTIAICACHRQAGTTTIALNLALMLGERNGEQVSLIDANFRSSGLTRGAVDGGGFSAFAAGTLPFEEAFVPVGEKVRLMHRGRADDPLVTLRAGASRLPAHAPQGAARTLIDLPPVLEHPDALMMAQATDGVLLVLEAEQTRWPVAREARQRIEAAGMRIVGAVLNRKPHYVPSWLYRLL